MKRSGRKGWLVGSRTDLATFAVGAAVAFFIFWHQGSAAKEALKKLWGF